MSNSEKSQLLKDRLNELIRFKTELTAENLDEFRTLKKEILKLLDDEQKHRLNQITFYKITEDYSNFNTDDLPF